MGKKVIKKEWSANIANHPGLLEDLNILMLKTGSHDHAELLQRMTFAHRNIKTHDHLYKLMLKPDSQCTKKEMIAKRVILRLYHFSGVSTKEVAELILDELDNFDEVNNIKESDKDKVKTKKVLDKDNVKLLPKAIKENNGDDK